VVHLVEVDVVGLESAQAVLAGLTDVERGQPRRVGPRVAAAIHLGGEHHLFAAALALGEPPPDDALRLTGAVRVGGVEEGDADVESGVHDLVARGLVGLRAEVHRAETQRAHAQSGATELAVVHARKSNYDGDAIIPSATVGRSPAGGSPMCSR